MTTSERKRHTFSTYQRYQELYKKHGNEHFFFALVFDEQGAIKIIQLTSPYHCLIINSDNFEIEQELMVQDLNYLMAKQTSLFLDSHKGSMESYMNKMNKNFLFNMRKIFQSTTPTFSEKK